MTATLAATDSLVGQKRHRNLQGDLNRTCDFEDPVPSKRRCTTGGLTTRPDQYQRCTHDPAPERLNTQGSSKGGRERPDDILEAVPTHRLYSRLTMYLLRGQAVETSRLGKVRGYFRGRPIYDNGTRRPRSISYSAGQWSQGEPSGVASYRSGCGVADTSSAWVPNTGTTGHLDPQLSW
ncbi:hypothetical protein FA15DRAFT_708322 [Coprinopsis marcescibilis]|uniref:Uncharacterized protein n=1 Tax=Coprinopsis marcescibilis TaxID=230819 RepID=A0A5C3KK00_COPMA|nr:hypothetical protein FA15DRAFT_708322 [Coprinopsis marcescibilis]